VLGAPRRAVDLGGEDQESAAQREDDEERARNEPAPQVQPDGDAPPAPGYWITECGVATMRVTLIFSRSIMVGTFGEISFFQ
jgi:hypothetical protein